MERGLIFKVLRHYTYARPKVSPCGATLGRAPTAYKLAYVRFGVKSGHVRCNYRRPLSANSGHQAGLPVRAAALVYASLFLMFA